MSNTKDLINQFNTPARNAKRVGREVFVPMIYDKNGNLLSDKKIGLRKMMRFSFRQCQFLKELRDSGGNFELACAQAHVKPDWARRFLRLQKTRSYLMEETHEAKLAEVASPSWVKAVYTQAALGETDPSENEKWGIDRLREIVIPKQSPMVAIQNVFNMPKLSEKEMEALKAIGDKLAMEPVIEAQVVQ